MVVPAEEKKMLAKNLNPKLFGDDEFDKVVEKNVENGKESSNSYLVALRAATHFSKFSEDLRDQGVPKLVES